MIKELNKIKIYKKLTKEEQLEWLSIVKPIIDSNEFLVRKHFLHHENESLYEHLIKVSIKSFKLAKKYKANTSNSAIAGLLHDFYPEAWQYSDDLKNIDKKYSEILRTNKKFSFFEKHGFVHGYKAKENSKKYYSKFVNERILDAISKHMFPLSIFTKNKFPKYKESWIVTYADKIISFINFPKIKNIPKYFGMKR